MGLFRRLVGALIEHKGCIACHGDDVPATSGSRRLALEFA
jgi:hypothetical protein